MTETELSAAIAEIARDSGAAAVAVATHDFQRGSGFELNGERWFHAASTIKLPVLLGVFDAIEQRRFEPFSRVHVRNRFSSAVDGSPYRIAGSRDANTEVHAARGRTMRIDELASHMIVTSSNLATNLLLDLVGVDAIRDTLARHGLSGIDLRRGVEDEAAWQAGLNNRITALGLCQALRLVEERRAVSAGASDAMLDIMHRQRFRGGIPAGLPEDARVANKTGEMSTVAHDGGIVYLPDRAPYVLVVLTEWAPSVEGRRETIARVSRAVYEHMTAAGA